MAPYGAEDAKLTYELFFKLKPKLEEQDLWPLFQQECELIPVLVTAYL